MTRQAVALVATHGRRGNGVPRCWQSMTPFRTSGAVRGDFLSGVGIPDAGRMPDEFRAKFREDAQRYGDALFVVWSYGTPIGWRAADGYCIRPDARYSVTTSRHQGMLYGVPFSEPLNG